MFSHQCAGGLLRVRRRRLRGLAVQACVWIGKIAGSEAFLSIDLGPDLAGAFAALEDLTRYLEQPVA